MYVKMKETVGELVAGEVYEVEDDDGQKYIDASQAEATDFKKDPEVDVAKVIDELVGKKVDAGIKQAFATIGKSDGSKETQIVVGTNRIALDPTGGFAHAGEFLKDVYHAATRRPSEKLVAWQTAVKTAGHMEEGDDSQGGFLVPTQFIADLKMNDIIDSGIAGRCTKIPMATNTVSIPFVNETTHATSVFGGVIVYRTAEMAQKQASKPTLGLCTLTLHKLTAFTYVTDELLEDSPISLQPVLANMFSQALGFVLDDDILNGTGAGMGLGVIPAPATITVARAGAGAIAWADILRMWMRLYPRSRDNSAWFANYDTFQQLAQMTQAVGTGGQAVWIPPGGAADSPHGRLMGQPLILTELCQTLGTSGDIILADLSQMFLGQKAGAAPKFESSIHLRFDYNEVAFRTHIRYDCQPWWPAPLTPRYSTQTLSPFVILGDVTTTTTAAP